MLRSSLPPHIIVLIFYPPLRKSARFILCHHTYSNQIKSLLLSHHHSTSTLVSEILESVLQTVQKFFFTYRQYILTEDNVQKTHTYTHYTQCTIKTYLVINTHYTQYVHILHYAHIYI